MFSRRAAASSVVPPSQSHIFAQAHYRRRTLLTQQPALSKKIVPLEVAAPTLNEKPIKNSQSVEVQSMYRESETQTVPYAPDYVIKPGAPPPEVLSIANLNFSHGLAITSNEVEIIERARQRRLFQRMLPPQTDEFSFNQRQLFLQEQEFREWQARDAHIEALQMKRLDLLKQALDEQEKSVCEKQKLKVDRAKARKMDEMDRLLMQNAKAKLMEKRRLNRQHIKLMNTSTLARDRRRDIIGEFVARKFSASPSRKSSVNLPGIPPPPEYLDETLKTQTELRGAPLVDSSRRLKHRQENELKSALDAASLQTVGMNIRDTVSKQKVAQMRERPDTPRLNERMVIDQEQVQGICVLQALLRGMAKQIKMVRGQEIRADLIEELQAAEK
eukprot:GHVL01018427.1.p1 GENE.GHVL01018427.1~~GHVL01018427.1.p1  ORF type:complete len:387 (-),score=60.94 GHVL01018427.1:769-1929(-)